MTTSYELIKWASDIVNELMTSEGVLNDDLETEIAEFLNESEDKLDKHRYLIKECKNRSQALKDEAKRLTTIAKQYENTANRVREYAQITMEARVELQGWDEGRKIKTDLGAVFLTARKSLNIVDEDQFINDWMNTAMIKQTPRIDRTKVTACLKAGKEVDGAELVESISITFK